MAYVYLLHLDSPLGNENNQAQYYLWSTKILHDRIIQHCSRQGAKMLEFALGQGIEFEIVSLWKFRDTKDSRLQEIKWKRWKNHKKLVSLNSPYRCPIPKDLQGRKFQSLKPLKLPETYQLKEQVA